MSRSRPVSWPAAVWAVVLAAALGAAGYTVWSVHREAADTIEAVEPRFARLAGLGDARDRLLEAAARSGRAIERHAYPAKRDASQAGNDAQQRVRDAFARAGLEVVSIQVLPARSQRQFDRIPVTMRVDGEYGALMAAVAALPTLAPSVFVEGFTLQGASGLAPEGSAPRVVLELQLFVLRVRA